MPDRRLIRRLAMQLLYQLDLRDQADWDDLQLWLHDCKGTPSEHEAASDLALYAWRSREAADVAATRMSPDWPSNRQPPIDRAILRLAYFEMATGRVHVKIAINEAIELAKQFSTGQSAAFINGVLDHLAKELPPTSDASSDAESAESSPATSPTLPASDAPLSSPLDSSSDAAALPDQDPWLSDALDNHSTSSQDDAPA